MTLKLCPTCASMIVKHIFTATIQNDYAFHCQFSALSSLQSWPESWNTIHTDNEAAIPWWFLYFLVQKLMHIAPSNRGQRAQLPMILRLICYFLSAMKFTVLSGTDGTTASCQLHFFSPRKIHQYHLWNVFLLFSFVLIVQMLCPNYLDSVGLGWAVYIWNLSWIIVVLQTWRIIFLKFLIFEIILI